MPETAKARVRKAANASSDTSEAVKMDNKKDATAKAEQVRIQFDLTQEEVNDIQELMARTRVSTRKDFFLSAIALLEWAIRERRAGRAIASVDESNKVYRELVMPILSRVVPD